MCIDSNHKLSSGITRSISVKSYQVKIDTRMSELFAFFSERYRDNPAANLIAFYHYAVATVPVDEIGGVIIKRPKLKDIYITEFNVSLLKAFDSRIELMILNGSGLTSQRNRFRQESQKPHWTVNTEIEDGIASTHQEVSLLEAFVMFDRKFLRSFASNPVEFIFAKKDRKTFFKKVKIATDTSFKAEGTDQLFEKQSTNVERFFSRSNLEPKLCLAEFVMFYDYAGVSESKELYKLFTQRGVEINDSEIRCAFSKDFLPEVILLRTGDVMKMRTNQKIIAFPSCENSL